MTITVSLQTQQNSSRFVALVAILDSSEFELFVKHISKNIDEAVRHVLDVRRTYDLYTPIWLHYAVDLINDDPLYNRIVIDTKRALYHIVTPDASPMLPPAAPPASPPVQPSEVLVQPS